jgi:hypothetical protein
MQQRSHHQLHLQIPAVVEEMESQTADQMDAQAIQEQQHHLRQQRQQLQAVLSFPASQIQGRQDAQVIPWFLVSQIPVTLVYQTQELVLIKTTFS